MRCRYTTQSVRHKAATYFVLYHLQYQSYDHTAVRTAQVMNSMSNALYYTVRNFLFEKKYFLCCKLHDRNILHVFLQDWHNPGTMENLIWRWIKPLVKRTLLQSDAPHMHQYERDWRPRIAAQHARVVCSAYSRSVRSGLFVFF